MKNILILLGSPRSDGNSDKLARAFAEGAQKNAANIETIKLSQKQVKGCQDCRKCWQTGKPCVIPDHMQEIYKAIDKADLIVFSTPLYWYTWSSQIKPVWDRLLPYVSKEAPRTLAGKEAVLLAAAGDSSEEVFKGLVYSFEKSCSLLGMKIVAKLTIPGVYNPKDIEQTSALKEAEKLGEDLTKN
ncbi:MAG: flavodoxin family protein [Thermovirga sp.]|nr:flavodoxin family protein [Thermovirga sp.]